MNESPMPETPAEAGNGAITDAPEPPPQPAATLTTEEFVSKGIAPVKREFLRPPPAARSSSAATDKEKDVTGKLVQEKKSKRQLKREHREERKPALILCPQVAKTGDATSCQYGSSCRFNHDLETYKAQKPADLDGDCPFSGSDGPCPYGLACRFSGTHGTTVAPPGGNTGDRSVGSEVNVLKKDVQKLLWKKFKMKFTKAEAALKLLGIQSKGFQQQKEKDDKEEEYHPEASVESQAPHGNGCKDDDDGSASADDNRPLKKSKSSNGNVVSGEVLEDILANEPQATNDDVAPETDASLKVHPRETKVIDFSQKLYLAPLTTVGNLPFRRVCKRLGADVTCGEMAMCDNLLQGQASEWALLRRHSSEDLFGVQICGAYPDTVARTVELIERECLVDFIDINMGCPIDMVVNKGAGSALVLKPQRMKNIIRAASAVASASITAKVRTGYIEGKNRVDSFIGDLGDWGACALTIHGRSRQQRYSKLADWEYINECVRKAPKTLQVLGNGDVCSYLDWNKHFSDCPELSSCMIARGALTKPWIFTEIKEQRHWDISSGERLDILKDYVHFGLQHWGSDSKGVETTRHFLLEWLSYTCRYIPVGLLDVIPQQLNWRPPSYVGRNDLETLMASESAADWIRISEMLLGKVPKGFTFAPKHKSNAYDSAENG